MTALAATGALNVLAALLEARTGQQINAERAWRIDTALRPLLRELELDTLDQLVARLLDGSAPGLGDRIVDAMLNRETSFFRDVGVLETVADAALSAAGDRTPRVWSAGCSTGQEPLSLAMLFAERATGHPATIIGSDVSQGAIDRARSGRFSQFEIQRGLPVRRMMDWFTTEHEEWQARPELIGRVQFRRHNLVNDPPLAGQFDVILCRNVLLYLSTPLRRQVLERFARAVRPGGYLVLGAGETVIGQSEAFRPSTRFRGLYERADAAPKRMATQSPS